MNFKNLIPGFLLVTLVSMGLLFAAINTPVGNLFTQDVNGNGFTLSGLGTISGTNVTATGTSSLDNGQITTDGAGDLAVGGVLYAATIYPLSGPIWANPSTRIIYDQYSEQAISTVSDSWMSDYTTTFISDPDYGYAVVNGSLLIRSGGSTVSQLGADGSVSAANGNFTVDTVGDVVLAGGSGFFGDGSSIIIGGSNDLGNILVGVNSAPNGTSGSLLMDNGDASSCTVSGNPLTGLFDETGNLVVYSLNSTYLDLNDGPIYNGGTINADSFAGDGSTISVSGNLLSGLEDGSGDFSVAALTTNGITFGDGGSITLVLGSGGSVPSSDGSESGIAVFQYDGSITQGVDDSTAPTNTSTPAGWIHTQVTGSDAWIPYYR